MPRKEYFSQALYTFDIGQNDITAFAFANISASDYIPNALNEFSSVIKVWMDYKHKIFSRFPLLSMAFYYLWYDCEFVLECRESMRREGGHFGSTTRVLWAAFLMLCCEPPPQSNSWTLLAVLFFTMDWPGNLTGCSTKQ